MIRFLTYKSTTNHLSCVEFIANARKLCSCDGDGVSFSPVDGAWREKKSDVTIDSDENDGDDGYSKSDETNSHHSTRGAVTTKSGNLTSSTSGVSSIRQWQNGSAGDSNTSGRTSNNGHTHEIVNKILISREVNEAIFKPGMLPHFSDLRTKIHG